MGADLREAFERLYETHLRAVHGYAARRSDPAAADDVVAETFATAWRRMPDLPGPDLHLAWLLGIARRQMANDRRGRRRRSALVQRVAAQPPAVEPAPDFGLDPALHDALSRLSEVDRELLCLIAWERLDADSARRVLGLSAVGLRVRLHRARRRVRAHLDEADGKRTPPQARAAPMTPFVMPGQREADDDR